MDNRSRQPKALPGKNGKICPAERFSATDVPRILNERYNAVGSWRIVAEGIGDVSPALVWKVAKGRVRSRRIERALGVPTQRRCQANGWLRRAVWVHESELARYEAWLARRGVGSLQELVDNEMMEDDDE